MAAGDMNWSDCGRTTDSQFFYGNPKGRRQVGRCGRYETRTALYASRLEKPWKRLFKKKFDREPSTEEFWAVITTGEIAKNVQEWEKEQLRGEKNPPRRPHIHRGRGGRRMVDILAQSVKKSRAREEAKIKAGLEEEEKRRIKFDDDTKLLKIRQSSELPIRVLQRIIKGTVDIGAIYILYGVDSQRIDELMQAFGLKG